MATYNTWTFLDIWYLFPCLKRFNLDDIPSDNKAGALVDHVILNTKSTCVVWGIRGEGLHDWRPFLGCDLGSEINVSTVNLGLLTVTNDQIIIFKVKKYTNSAFVTSVVLHVSFGTLWGDT